ncbi:MAG: DNA translocase FtsK 4TM domain-containing protein [Phycisphaerae bacterium]
MAKKEDKAKAKAPKDPAAGGRFGRYCFVLVLICVVVLTWLSLLTYSPFDPPSRLVAAESRSVTNAAGFVGAKIAYTLHRYIGGGAYMGLLFATVAAAVMIIGGRIKDLYWRLIGVALMVAGTSATIYLWNPAASADLDTGAAGVLGKWLGAFLSERLRLGSWLIVGFALCIGLMLTADNIVLQIPKLGKRIWEKRNELPTLVNSLRPRLATPATADVPTVTAAPRAIAAMPAKSAQKAKPADKPAPEPAARVRVVPPPAPQSQAPVASPAKPQAELPSPGPKRDGKADSLAAAPAQAKPQVQSSPAVKPAAAPAPAPRPPEPQVKLTPAKPDKAAPAKSPSGDGQLFPLPSADLLTAPSGGYEELQEQQAEIKRAVLQQTLNDFSVQAEVVGHQTGPVITLFELSLSPGVKVAQIANLATDIARALAVPGVRIVSPIPGKDTVGVEVPNLQKEIVRIRELMSHAPDAEKKFHLPLYLGKDAGGDPIVADLGAMPHMLIAGTTGSGKSVCINSIIVSLLMTRSPRDVRLILVDPKMVEMAAFENIPHLLCPIVNDMRSAENMLEWAASKMDERYEILREANVKNIVQFNRLGREEVLKRFEITSEEEAAAVPTHMPYYVIIIDELADLIMTSSKEVEGHIIRIAQKARAVGIHLILATQRPSVNVVTGLIKSNMPCRISFRVASRQESRIVLDQNGADVLLGQGDMLFLQPGSSNLVRAQGTFVDDNEIRTVVNAVKQTGEPSYEAELMRINTGSGGEGGGERDELFDKAVEVVLQTQRGSVSLIQRRLQVGYSRASRIIDQMADAGILGDYKGSQARECLITLEDWEAMQASIEADKSGASAANGEPTSV